VPHTLEGPVNGFLFEREVIMKKYEWPIKKREVIMEKSCFNCRNQYICKHHERIFKKFEIGFIMIDTSGFVNLIAEGLGCRCKYYSESIDEKKEDRR
jgi:hypothetical protein